MSRKSKIDSQQSMLFQVDSPVRMSRLPGLARDLLETDQDYSSALLTLLNAIVRDGSLSKMCPVFYPAKREETSTPSSVKWLDSGIAWPGGCLTLSTTDWPSDAEGCTLSEVLETDVPLKYYLSPRACRGLLQRSEERERWIPPILEGALRSVAQSQEP